MKNASPSVGRDVVTYIDNRYSEQQLLLLRNHSEPFKRKITGVRKEKKGTTVVYNIVPLGTADVAATTIFLSHGVTHTYVSMYVPMSEYVFSLPLFFHIFKIRVKA